MNVIKITYWWNIGLLVQTLLTNSTVYYHFNFSGFELHKRIILHWRKKKALYDANLYILIEVKLFGIFYSFAFFSLSYIEWHWIILYQNPVLSVEKLYVIYICLKCYHLDNFLGLSVNFVKIFNFFHRNYSINLNDINKSNGRKNKSLNWSRKLNVLRAMWMIRNCIDWWYSTQKVFSESQNSISAVWSLNTV